MYNVKKKLDFRRYQKKNLEYLVPTKLKKPKDTKLRGDDLWKFPKVDPSESDIKLMFSEAIVFALKLFINNHLFVFN